MLFSAGNLICGMVESMLPRFTQNICLSMMVDLRVSDYSINKGGDDSSARKFVRLIFYRPSNYTKVFALTVPHLKDVWVQWGEETEVKLECDHDSCWRDSTVDILTKSQFAISDILKERGSKKTPAEMSWHVSFGLSGDPAYHWLHKCEPVNREDRYKSPWKIIVGSRIDTHNILIPSSVLNQQFWSMEMDSAPRICEACFLGVHEHQRNADGEHLCDCKNMSRSGHQCVCSGTHWPELMEAIKQRKGKPE
jgi:hypothetical protein